MDWTRAIEVNRDDLLRVVVGLCALAGLVVVGPMVRCLPRALRLQVLAALRPAESAARRLVVLQAQQENQPDDRPRAAPERPIPRGSGGRGTQAFPLFDPRMQPGPPAPRRAKGAGPRVFFFDETDPVIAEEIAASDDDPMDARRIYDRLRRLRDVLENLSKHGRRLLRAQARLARTLSVKRFGVLRPGRPPGHRHRRRHPVDGILAECEALARVALVPKPPD